MGVLDATADRLQPKRLFSVAMLAQGGAREICGLYPQRTSTRLLELVGAGDSVGSSYSLPAINVERV